MARAQVSVDIRAAIEAVRSLIGAYELLADFHPQIAACHVDGEGVGATRTLFLADGQEIVERLVEERSDGYVYEGLVASANLTAWRGRIEVTRVGEHARATWTLEMELAPGVDEAAMLAQQRGILEEGLMSAKRQLEGLTGHGA